MSYLIQLLMARLLTLTPSQLASTTQVLGQSTPLKDMERAEYHAVKDDDALAAFHHLAP
jgi:hypothetical protein